MKVKVISRNPDEYLRETKMDLHKVPRNYDPSLHPLEGPREYVRAMNATKLERVFAKPFIGDLDGHKDGIACMAMSPESLSSIVSGAYDGEIILWDLPTRTVANRIRAHDGWVRGIAYTADSKSFISVGDDKTIKVWSMDNAVSAEETIPSNTILCRNTLTSISHHTTDSVFATCGEEICQLWDETRNEPLKTLQWGADTLHHVKFNPIETNLLASCASDRSIILYDKREQKPLKKIIMTMRSNQLSWNPMEAFMFTIANEDYNLYTFDSRQLKNPLRIHKGHVSAVTSVDYSPTGREFIAGSYDRTIRLFDVTKSYSRDIYHTKRMQHVTCVAWSLDNKFVYSGSDEMNIRIWKSDAAEKLGVLRPRERAAMRYNEALKEKYSGHPQIRRIAKHRHIPKKIFLEQGNLQEARNKIKRKEANRRANSKPGTVPHVSHAKKVVIKKE